VFAAASIDVPSFGIAEPRVSLPFRLTAPDGAFSATFTPGLGVGPGAAARFVGAPLTVSSEAAGGWRNDVFDASASARVTSAFEDEDDWLGLDRRWSVEVAAALGVRPVRSLRTGLTFTARGYSDDDIGGALAAEVAAMLPDGFGVAAALGHGVGDAPGTPGVLGQLRVTWSPDADSPAARPTLAETETSPWRARVLVSDSDGTRIPAALRAVGPDGAARDAEAPGGEAVLALGPGAWSVEVRADGRATHTHRFVLDEPRATPITVESYLQPVSADAARLEVTPDDPYGPVDEGALLEIDARPIARLGPDGAVVVDGLARGEARVGMAVSGYLPVEPALTRLGGTSAFAPSLTRPAGSVRVHTRAPDGASTPARVPARMRSAATTRTSTSTA
jgi:hypothetical protein